jgi:hypothetical protein
VVCDVGCHELALDGEVERGAHDHVHLEDGLRRETGAVAAATRGTDVRIE